MPVFTRDDRKLLFVHIPKTGGSSIERAFRDAHWSVDYWSAAGTPINRLLRCTPQHQHAELLRELFYLERFDAIFAFVRNPYARVKSEFAMKHMGLQTHTSASVLTWLKGSFKAYRKDPFVADNHMRPQWQFLLPGMAVFRLENGLHNAFRYLDKICGPVVPEAPVYREKDSAAKDGIASSQVPLSDEAVTLVRKFYRRDFEELSYPVAYPENTRACAADAEPLAVAPARRRLMPWA